MKDSCNHYLASIEKQYIRKELLYWKVIQTRFSQDNLHIVLLKVFQQYQFGVSLYQV